MERTARYNFEGGDTAWQEQKLGSYATSETRFIEILETLCQKTEFECNVFVEESEEFLEEWYRNPDRDKDDFERWLCIEKAVVCCPEYQYGPDCKDCPGEKGRPCFDNGLCKGDGSRGGDGTCICEGGYKGKLCDVCKKGFYESFRNETDVDCEACDVSCASTCTGPGPTACKKCKGGYLWDQELGCQDIDECKRDPETFPCKKEQYCENTAGSYTCSNCDIACTECLGPGNEKCIACRTGFSMVDNVCRDIDECENNPCMNVEHMECNNSPGSYFCECVEGYISDGEKCVDKSVLTPDDEKTEGKGMDGEGADQQHGGEGEVETPNTSDTSRDKLPANQVNSPDVKSEGEVSESGSTESLEESSQNKSDEKKEEQDQLKSDSTVNPASKDTSQTPHGEL